MTNYEKLCVVVGIGVAVELLEFPKHRNYILKHPNGECIPTFTAEKQLELIKLLMKIGCFSGYTYITEETKQNNYVLVHFIKEYQGYQNTDFIKALTGLTLKLIETGEIDKEKVKEILQ